MQEAWYRGVPFLFSIRRSGLYRLCVLNQILLAWVLSLHAAGHPGQRWCPGAAVTLPYPGLDLPEFVGRLVARIEHMAIVDTLLTVSVCTGTVPYDTWG
jgi:hypothetical protein